MKTLWKADRRLHPAFARFNRSLAQDWFLLPHELKLQRAHAQALEVAGLLSRQERTALEAALREIEAANLGQTCPDSDAEDLHTWIEAELTNKAGAAGKKIHTARSRNDQVATLLVMYVIDAGDRLVADLRKLIEALCTRAQAWSELLMPMMTHTQLAAPGSAGFWALRFATAFDRLRRHAAFLSSLWRSACPLGSGAVAGSSLPVDRRVQASELGFERPSANALYSTSARDECLELLALLSQAALHLQTLAVDVITFSQTNLRWTVYPTEFATGSSMMPNKSNPDAMELLRGECNAVVAAQAHAVLLLKGLPSGYNRDLQGIKPVVREAVEKMQSLCELAAAFVERLKFDADRLRESARQGAIDATLRMERLVAGGMTLRDAHHRVAEEVQNAPQAVPAETVADISLYQTAGSASPAETRRVATELLAALQVEAQR